LKFYALAFFPPFIVPPRTPFEEVFWFASSLFKSFLFGMWKELRKSIIFSLYRVVRGGPHLLLNDFAGFPFFWEISSSVFLLLGRVSEGDGKSLISDFFVVHGPLAFGSTLRAFTRVNTLHFSSWTQWGAVFPPPHLDHPLFFSGRFAFLGLLYGCPSFPDRRMAACFSRNF